jgi:hypothetical protein
MSNPYPHELSFGDLYISPVVVVVVLGFFLTGVSVVILNRLKVSRYFFAPSYIFLAIWVLYIILIDKFWIKF